jgi:hypothetical protein
VAVTASDSPLLAGNTKQTTAKGTINVVDVNDLPPVFDAVSYTASIDETTADTVYPVVVKDFSSAISDADCSFSLADLTLTITAGKTSVFGIDGMKVVLNGELDYESYTAGSTEALKLEISDGKRQASADFSVTVRNVNDVKPTCSGKLVADRPYGSGKQKRPELFPGLVRRSGLRRAGLQSGPHLHHLYDRKLR